NASAWIVSGGGREVVNLRENAGRGDLVDAPDRAVVGARVKCAVEVPIAGLDQTGSGSAVAARKRVQILVHPGRGKLVNIPAAIRIISGNAIEVAVGGLDGRVYRLSIAVHSSEVVEICKRSGWRQPENAAIAPWSREASSVEISIAGDCEPREAETKI